MEIPLTQRELWVFLGLSITGFGCIPPKSQIRELDTLKPPKAPSPKSESRKLETPQPYAQLPKTPPAQKL